MFAAERTTPRVTTPGMVMPMGESPRTSSKWSTIWSMTSATASGVALGEEVALEPLEPADRLVEQTANLGDMTCGREDLGPHSVAHGRAHVLGERRLELGGGAGERLDLAA